MTNTISARAALYIYYVDSLCSLCAKMLVGNCGPYVELEQGFTRQFVNKDEL